MNLADMYIEFLNKNLKRIQEILRKNKLEVDDETLIDNEIMLFDAICEFCVENTDKEILKIKRGKEELTQ